MLSPSDPAVCPPEHRPHIYAGREATHGLNILIIGCGLGGIAAAHTLSQAGHSVTIFEAARKIGEVGAGIVLQPPITRLLARWGASDALRAVGVIFSASVHLRYSTGEIIDDTPLGEGVEKAFGAPGVFLHRADFHKILSDLALSSPRVSLRMCSNVVSIDPTPNPDSRVSVTLASGEVVFGDLVIGADGIKSLTRQLVVGHIDPPEPTGDAAYRAILPSEGLLKDPDLRGLVEKGNLTDWFGEGTHMVGYPISAGKQYNLVFLHPDDDAIESWAAKGDVNKMREQFAKYEPRVQKILSLVDNPTKWKLLDHKPLKSWVHPEGHVVLLGDACHPMLPYLAQGAAMAIEDAAVLGNILSHISSISQLPFFLRTYERLRHARTSELQLVSRAMQKVYHLPDGPEQQARDARMRAAMNSHTSGPDQAEIAVSAVAGDEMGAKPTINGKLTKPSQPALSPPSKEKYAEWFSYDPDALVDSWWAEEKQKHLSGTLKSVA